ncbi:hypothetical protein FOA52_004298 [Chlamydomonas sp. UWO 241]|nr:hypothetical protein FOA52_004298 [Chlamydomonas sp. UWO 241]
MSERESVPVAFMGRHLFLTLEGQSDGPVRGTACDQNPNATMPSDAEALVASGDHATLMIKVTSIRNMLGSVGDLVGLL